MDIRIGITNAPRELSFESKQAPEDIQKVVTDALEGTSAFFTLTDVKGRVYLVPTQGLAYIELGGEEARRVGFVA
jgi:hypothetical protein